MISVAIPTYDRDGEVVPHFTRCLQLLQLQSNKDFEVIISDNSDNNNILDIATSFCDTMKIKYSRNPEKGAATNANNAVELCNGNIVKFLCQDDLLFNTAIEITSRCFEESPEINWAVCSYYHTKDGTNLYNLHVPKVSPMIALTNTIGTPSCVTFKKDKFVGFDTNLSYFYDCEFYHRMISSCGFPEIITVPLMANVLWEGSETSRLTQELYDKEVAYVRQKTYGM